MEPTHIPTRDLPTIEDFTSIYDLYQNAIARYCSFRCRDTEVGHDIKQAVFLRFWICLERKEEILHTRAFLYRIAHNLVVDYVRKKKDMSLDQLLETGFEPAMDPWPQISSQLDCEKPLVQLKAMDNEFGTVLHSRYVLGLPPSEIARRTGETANTVSVRIFRGLRHLRTMLKEKPAKKKVRQPIRILAAL